MGSRLEASAEGLLAFHGNGGRRHALVPRRTWGREPGSTTVGEGWTDPEAYGFIWSYFWLCLIATGTSPVVRVTAPEGIRRGFCRVGCIRDTGETS